MRYHDKLRRLLVSGCDDMSIQGAEPGTALRQFQVQRSLRLARYPLLLDSGRNAGK